MTTRADVIAKAREYLDTPFRHQGRRKGTGRGAGVDCLGLLIGIGHDLGFVPLDYDQRRYTHQPDSATMRAGLAERLEPIAVADARPGDVAFMAFAGDPTHVAVLTDIGMLHAYSVARRVVEHGLDDTWRSRIREAFRIPGLED